VGWFQGLSALTGGWVVPQAAHWSIRVTVIMLAIHWIWRSFRTEDQFVAQTVQRAIAQPVKLGANAAAALKSVSEAAQSTLVIQPENKTVPAQAGQSLLELIESCGGRIESGCRMGVCGADPVAVREGADCLSPMGDDERNTLERLGHATNTRMACSARMQKGAVHIALVPDKAAPASTSSPQAYDHAIERVIIIGNGVAGVTAADHVRRRHPKCSIRLVAEESHPLYNRMGITRLVYGRSAMQGLYLMPEAWYSDRNIEVLLNTAVRAIHPQRKELNLADGETLTYDRLILATGSSSFVPPLPGWGGDGCFVLRSADDAMAVRAYAQRSGAQHAVVAGGGLLGLEAAYALHKLGLAVTVVERNAWLLHRQLDERGAQVLQAYLAGLGVRMRLGARLQSLGGAQDGPAMLQLEAEEALPAEILVVAAGVAPNSGLAKEAGLDVQRGVLVDEHMATSAPDIYAAGDVAEFAGRVMGLWPVAVEQAEIAARNALGEQLAYVEPVLSTMLKVVGADLVSVGEHEGQEGDEVIFEQNLVEYRYRKLVIRHGQLKGAILIGWPGLVESVNKAVKSGMDVAAHVDALRRGDWASLEGVR
jgi:NADPH-dependent 2,4-dienoyl-CoA reductase/sulfur reductase-like enzyme/ferredoxin